MPIKSQVEGSVYVSVGECACVFQQLKCQIKTNVSHHGVSVVETELASVVTGPLTMVALVEENKVILGDP